MAISQGTHITISQINDLINKLNAECNRRKSSSSATVATESTLSLGSTGDLDNVTVLNKLKSINQKRITLETYRINRNQSYTNKAGSYNNNGFKGGDLTNGNLRDDYPIHSNDYNTLLSDLNALNTMCACNTVNSTSGTTSCSCNTQSCSTQSCCDSDASCCNTDCSECSANRGSCGCESVDGCNCNSVGYDTCNECCDSNCSNCCDGDCHCNKVCSNNSCSCNTVCTCNKVCVEFTGAA